MIAFKCAKCGEELEAPASLVGQLEKCPVCGNLTIVPSLGTTPPVASKIALQFEIPESLRRHSDESPKSSIAEIGPKPVPSEGRAPDSRSSPHVQAMPTLGFLRFRREHSSNAIIVTIHVYVDGRDIGELVENQEIMVPVAVGNHSLRAKAPGFFGSKDMPVTVPQDDVLDFLVKSMWWGSIRLTNVTIPSLHKVTDNPLSAHESKVAPQSRAAAIGPEPALLETSHPIQPLVIPLIIALCIFLFYLGIPPRVQEGMRRWLLPPNCPGALDGGRIRLGEWSRILTYAFLHAGFPHLILNMATLAYVGVRLERNQGSRRVALIFLFSIITGALASLWWNPEGSTIGASAGVFGLLGATAVVLQRFGKDPATRTIFGVGNWVVGGIICGLVSSFQPGIDMAAHVGGLAGGIVIGLCLLRPSRGLSPQGLANQILATSLLLIATAIISIATVASIPEPQESAWYEPGGVIGSRAQFEGNPWAAEPDHGNRPRFWIGLGIAVFLLVTAVTVAGFVVVRKRGKSPRAP